MAEFKALDADNFQSGYFILSRSIINSAVFKNPLWLKVFIWCISRANHQKVFVSVKKGRGYTVETLDRGQFITGRLSGANELDIPPSTLRNILEKFKKLEILDIKKDSNYSIITVCNYNEYQNHNNYKGQLKGQQKDSKRTAKGQQKDTDNKYKEYKTLETNKEGPPLPPQGVSPELWEDFLKHRQNKKAPVTDIAYRNLCRNLEVWAAEGIDPEQPLRDSIANNWQGVFRPKQPTKPVNNKPKKEVSVYEKDYRAGIENFRTEV